MQIQNNYNSPNFTAYNFTTMAKDLLVNKLKKGAPEEVSSCIRVINSQLDNPVTINIRRTHNYWESVNEDKFMAEINKDEFQMRARESVLEFLERVAKIANKEQSAVIKEEMQENGRTVAAQADYMAEKLDTMI